MTKKLFIALYFGLFVSMVVLFSTNSPMAGLVFLVFFVLAIFGGLVLADRPHFIVLGFLTASLIVLGIEIFTNQNTTADWITITVGASMSALSAFTLSWVFLHPPAIKTVPSIEEKGYGKMNEQEFLHKVSAETNVNIELLKDLYQNEEFWKLIRAGKILDAIQLLRSMQPMVELREAKMVVEAFAERKDE